MNQKNIELSKKIVKPSYIQFGQNSLTRRSNLLKQILSQRQLPQKGLDDLTIKYFLDTLALMDSNNFDEKTGVGQRQSRIYSNLVQQRHYHMGHGIGRSGDIMANQPKAAGSSLLLQITRYLTISALKQLHYDFVDDVLLLPLATGMSLSLAFLTLAEMEPTKKYVIWSRIDQKTCLKSIQTANLIPIVIDLVQYQDMLTFNPQNIQNKIKQIGVDNILCIISTTSCFAPRIPDDVQINSQIAKKYGIYHVVNNAYGLWCTKIAHKIKQGSKKGQCTIVVQSTDKNFMVPVGGSIIFTSNQKILQKISSKYPGRANASPIVDMFITLLSMGKTTIRNLHKQRKQLYQYMKEKAIQFAKNINQKVLQSPSNTISIAMRIRNLQFLEPTQLGSILYSKKVMGHRVVKQSEQLTKIGNNSFKNYGSHHDKYTQLPYITFACAVGTKKQQINLFFKRFEKSIKQINKKQKKLKSNKQMINTITTIYKTQNNSIELQQYIKLQHKQFYQINQDQSNCQQQKEQYGMQKKQQQ